VRGIGLNVNARTDFVLRCWTTARRWPVNETLGPRRRAPENIPGGAVRRVRRPVPVV